jgi:hypothetical protein
MPRLVAVLAFIVLAAMPRVAQGQTITDQRVWTTVSVQQPFGGTSWRWFGDVIARSRDGLDDLDTTAFRGGISRDLTATTALGGGFAASQSYPAVGGVAVERRLFGQFQWRGSTAGGTVVLRTRFERRAVEGNSGAAWRLREQVRFSRAIAAGSRVSMVAWDEVFVHTNATTRFARGLDQNRAFVGVGMAIASPATLEIGYLNQFSDSRIGPNRTNHVLQTTLSLAF